MSLALGIPIGVAIGAFTLAVFPEYMDMKKAAEAISTS